VVDGDAEVLLDGLDQLPGAAGEGGVDAVLAGPGDRDDQVTGDGQHRDALAGRLDPHHQGDVVALATDVAVAASVGLVQALAGVGADHQQVERVAAAGLVQAGDLHRADLVEAVVHVAVPGRGGHDQEHQEQAAPHQ